MKKTFLLLCAALLGCAAVSAQTDYTSRIVNPSFEREAEGWAHKGMGAQGNNVFDIKDGNIYMEKWTGRGGAVGDGYLRQELSSLPPGNYELTAAAQNIQEDTPRAAQSGAWLFAGGQKTTVTVRDHYTVRFNYVSGSVTIGFEAVGASGNWIAVDDFRLTLVGSDLSEELAAAIQQTAAQYGAVTGRESQQLLDAIEAARQVAARTDATAEEQAAAITAMQQAVEKYLCANASPDQPWDLTDRIVNPSFEVDGMNGWTQTGMSTQGNNVFSIKKGNIYVERWTGKGGAVGDGRISQRLTNMLPGRYRLKAAAQNIQEDTPRASQTGAWIFANTYLEAVTLRDDYTLEFVLVSDEMEIGFEAKGATGNWIAVDNFRLEYIGDSFDDIKEAFAALIAQGESLTAQKTNSDAHQQLTTALVAAKTAYADLQPSTFNVQLSTFPAIATALEAAIQTATASQEVFARLAAAIDAARSVLSSSAAEQTEDYQAAIDAAQATYDTATTDAAAEAAITVLAEATFAFRVLNGGQAGNLPTVKTDPRFIKGCTWAFGRSTVSGSDIVEQGFCWAENPDPRVTDQRTTEYLNQAGRIYWLRDLKPATIYYMRAYAINKDYGVGYGDVIKFATLPKGQVGHWYNNGGDEETNDRINYAINTSMDYYWNNLTSIHGFGISVTYSPGTPTADCSYGGSMRVGASSSYQQPGTIMHEALHGIGVGTHGNWWSGDYRPGGVWDGNQVRAALRFWDNNTDGELHGDDLHMWPYGCNGAHEDTHSDNLYCMMGILAQALNEDGLPGSGAIGYALPYYSFMQEDTIKYYIKNEDEKHGLRTSYLVETAGHQLQWKAMTPEEAMANDAAAWYITFTPANQYYQLRNAASGYYITYASGFKTANHAKPTSADNIHLMRGRVDVEGHRGYYLIHPQSSANPPALNASTAGKTASASWNVARSATTQRWLILTAKEAENLDNGNLDLAREELQQLLARIRQLAQTPHTETTEGADAQLEQELTAIEQAAQTCTKGMEVEQLSSQARAAMVDFLCAVAVADVEQPFDLTFLVENPDFTSSSTAGWTSERNPGYEAGCDEYYETTFNFYQTLENMPAGVYQLRANAFQRAGETNDAFSRYTAGKETITTLLYINSTSNPVMSIFDDRQPTQLYVDGDASDKRLSDGTYVPNVMKAAATYFGKGLYDSHVNAELAKAGANLRIGIRCTKATSWYWSIYDNFRLHFFGGNRTLVGIEAMQDEESGVATMPQTYKLLRGGRLIIVRGTQQYDATGMKIGNR